MYNKDVEISDEQFADMIEQAFDELPRAHMKAVKNVAIVYADEPTPEQRVQLELRHDQTLFGLYEGVPLARRQGLSNYGPDKITIFKWPLLQASADLQQLRANVKHTLWHEIAHYFGLNHTQIYDLERRKD